MNVSYIYAFQKCLENIPAAIRIATNMATESVGFRVSRFLFDFKELNREQGRYIYM